VEQRDEAIKKAKAGSMIWMRASATWKGNCSEWERMDQGARKKARATLVALRRERTRLPNVRWTQHSSAEIVGAGQGRLREKATKCVRQSFAKARKEL